MVERVAAAAEEEDVDLRWILFRSEPLHPRRVRSPSPSPPSATSASSILKIQKPLPKDSCCSGTEAFIINSYIKLVKDSDITINSRHVLASCCRLLEINMSSGATWCGRKRLSITHSTHLALM